MAKLSKALMRRAADKIDNGNSFTCTAIAWNRNNMDADQHARRQYVKAASACGWPVSCGELHTLEISEENQALRFDFLNLLAEAGPECW